MKFWGEMTEVIPKVSPYKHTNIPFADNSCTKSAIADEQI